MKGVKYNLHFQDRTGNELSFNELTEKLKPIFANVWH